MTDTLCFSGWGQAHDSLKVIAPNATHVNYAQHRSLIDALAPFKGQHFKVGIGWSLGGQLLLRGIEEGHFKVDYLILLATPFKFVRDDNFRKAMRNTVFYDFKHAFSTDPEKTLRTFPTLICEGDVNKQDILTQITPSSHENHHWSEWLEHLETFSCYALDFIHTPPTLVIHGDSDSVVHPSQASLFLPFFPKHSIMMLENCGHAPHLHDTEQVQKAIANFTK